MTNAAHDANYVPTIIGVSSIDLSTPTRIAVNPSTGALLIDGQSLISSLSSTFLKLDQTTPQTTIGTFTFPSVISPLLIGGTQSGDTLSIKGTSGNGTLTNPAIQFLVGNNGATNALTILNNGNVGINNSNPLNRLSIIDNNIALESVLITNTTAGASSRAGIKIQGDGGFGTLVYRSSSSTFVPNAFQLASSAGNIVLNPGNGATGLMYLTTGGLVGIGTGTTAPLTKLDVVSADSIGIRALSSTALGSTSGGGLVSASNSTPTSSDQRIGLWAASAISTGTTYSYPSRIMAWSSESWSATATGTYLTFHTTANGTTTLSERMRILANGNTGIGTINPENKLEVSSNSNSVVLWPLVVSNVANPNATGTGAGIKFRMSDPTDGVNKWSGIAGIAESNFSNDVGLALYTTSLAAGNSEKMRITASGNVGIGTNVPFGKLHILGGGSSSLTIPNATHGIVLTSNTSGYNRIYFENTAATGGQRVFALSNASGSFSINSTSDNGQTYVNQFILSATYNGLVGINTGLPNSTLHINGSLATKIDTITTTTTLDSTYYKVLCNGTFTVNLPTAVGISGREYIIKNISTGLITIDANGTETIDGQLTQTLNQWNSLKITSDGSNWYII